MNHQNATSALTRSTLLVAGLFLIAANLRAPFTGVAPVLEMLQSAFELSPAQAGLLTTLPLLAFGVISPFAAMFAREYGLERMLFIAMALVAAGVAMRAGGAMWTLYLGTAIIGIGIALGNVLLPSLVKRDFPSKVPTITAACAIAMGGAGALASASAFPLGSAFGWQTALGAVLILPLAAMAMWIAQLGVHSRPAQGTASPPHGGRVWRSTLAWQVTLFMGINSLLYYVLIGWLPSILIEAGFSPATAGSLHGEMQLASAVPGLFLGPIVNRMKDQKLIASGMGVLMGIALLGLCYARDWASIWVFCFGFGSGGGVLLALMFMGLRAGNAYQAAALSGMAQCVGYLLAAGGPALAGQLHDLTHNWTMALMIGIALSLAMAIFGLLAGRALTVGNERA